MWFHLRAAVIRSHDFHGEKKKSNHIKNKILFRLLCNFVIFSFFFNFLSFWHTFLVFSKSNIRFMWLHSTRLQQFEFNFVWRERKRKRKKNELRQPNVMHKNRKSLADENFAPKFEKRKREKTHTERKRHWTNECGNGREKKNTHSNKLKLKIISFEFLTRMKSINFDF